MRPLPTDGPQPGHHSEENRDDHANDHQRWWSTARPPGGVAAGAAIALAVPLLPAGAQVGVEGTTEWISEDATGSGGRELSSMSADGRYVAFVGRAETSQGVWVKDRMTGATEQLTNGPDFNPDISGGADR